MNPVVLRSVLGYFAAQRAAQGGAQSFMDATKFLVANMLRSLSKKLEIEMFYGQMGYGTVASVAGNVITITTAEFAAGIWAGAEGMPLEIRTSAAVLRGTCKVSSVDLAARTVTVDALPAGVAGTDVLWHLGAYGNEFAGVHKILSNSGTLFNISASSYSLWAGNATAAGSAALSLTIIEKAVAAAVNKGLDGDVVVYCNPKAWNDLLVTEAGKRQYDQSYSSAMVETGAKAIKFHGMSGAISIVPSIYVKEGLIARPRY